MTVKRIAAETLIELAVETLRGEFAEGLPADKRYTIAMVAHALDVARREILADGEGAAWKLLDELYDDGEGTLAQLAADIRSGKISERSHPDLRARLIKVLIAELEVKNPRFLKDRHAL